MPCPQERRRYRRSVVSWPATVLTPQTQIDGRIENISPVGAFISFGESPPLEGDFRMVINPPNHQTINVVAKVIWSTVISAAKGSLGFGMGVEFIRISEADRKFLAKPLE